MRPIHPFWAYAIESLSAIPLRLTIAAPLAIVVLFWTGYMVDGLAMAAIGLLAIVGAWLISFSANLIFGALSLFTQSSIKLMDVWIAGYFVMSGYLVPLSLFPAIVRNAPYWMPFRYLLGFPVELWSGALSMHEALMQLAAQWTWVVLLGALAALTWNRGLKRFSAVSG
jgi:ABC-2 type transport system permease protein